MIEHKPIVITIVGAESSGKTTLAMHLAEYFGCLWVPEYAREYLEGLDRPYNEGDLNIIAEKQLEAILSAVSSELSVVSSKLPDLSARNPLKGESDELKTKSDSLIELKESKIENRMLRPAHAQSGATAQQPSKIIIVDGGMMTLKIWAKIKYHKSIQIVEDALRDDITDIYLLCRPHKEWTPDPLREAPSEIERVWIYNQYLEELVDRETVVEIVRVEENEKLELIILNIEKFLNEKFSKKEDQG